jgi:hypothetical protein
MKNWLILFLAAALPWGLVAQDSPQQQQLPNAPSTSKYPPQPPAPVAPPPSAPTPADTPQTRTAPTTAPPASTPNAGNAGVPAASGTPALASDVPDDTVTVIRKRVDEVNVVFTVTDKREHFIKDLTQNDFRVMDDNKPALSVQSFSRQTNLPLRVGLLIDASN